MINLSESAKCLIIIIIGTIACICVTSFLVKHNPPSYTSTAFHQRCDLEYYAAKENLVCEVDSYIQSVAPGSSVNGLAIVNVCEKYDLDIRFVLAQAHLESHFGTKGVAAKTNSIFNVLAYDGRSAEDMINKGHGYKHPDQSIEPYAKLLRQRYLVDGKTEKDLLHEFVNDKGARYASDEKYEQMLSNRYVAIDSTTNITNKYKHFIKCKIIAEK